MALAPLATTADLAAWMQTDEASLPVGADLVLRVASKIVRRQARQRFTRETTTVELYPDEVRVWSGRCYAHPVTLNQRPVVSVDAVKDENGVDVAYTKRRDTLYLRCYAPVVFVTYTHGYSEVPEDVLGVLLTACARVLNNPNDLRQETVGATSVTYAAETIGSSLSQKDKDLLAGYRRTAAVVSVR